MLWAWSSTRGGFRCFVYVVELASFVCLGWVVSLPYPEVSAAVPSLLHNYGCLVCSYAISLFLLAVFWCLCYVRVAASGSIYGFGIFYAVALPSNGVSGFWDFDSTGCWKLWGRLLPFVSLASASSLLVVWGVAAPGKVGIMVSAKLIA